ncbi:uncharacterized protein LOC111254387 isoform X1 [Varroa destructor]|uniref:Secreted protein n=1 Tax=Varroa destructor TaxID=109461 RepID=A0A7M7KYF3_VARDE|nr:uncharacterized protein LOC111254387 isoform X1 [Varroa destructor]
MRSWTAATLTFCLVAGVRGHGGRQTPVTSFANNDPGELQTDQERGREAPQSESQFDGGQGGIPTIPLKIRIPESMEFVHMDAAFDSTIPDCIRKDPASIEENGGITVTAETFTDCARHELRRIQDKFETQNRPSATSGPRGKSDKAAEDSGAAPVEAVSGGRESGQENEQDNNRHKDKPDHDISDHDRINQGILAQHGIRGSGSAAAPKATTDTIVNATASAVPGSSSNDMLAVIQTVFDYKRVMTDLRRILRGDVFGVLGEYPGRMNGLFKIIQELPRRIMKSIGIVNRLRNATTDTTFRGVLTNLKEYLTQASHTAKDLPTAFTLVSVMDTLRNVASKISDNAQQNTEQKTAQLPAQRMLLSRVEEILRNPLGEVFNMGPYRKIAHGAEQGRQFLSRRIFDFHPDRIFPNVLNPLTFFYRRPHQTNGQAQGNPQP